MIRQKFPWKVENAPPPEFFDLDRIEKTVNFDDDTQPMTPLRDDCPCPKKTDSSRITSTVRQQSSLNDRSTGQPVTVGQVGNNFRNLRVLEKHLS